MWNLLEEKKDRAEHRQSKVISQQPIDSLAEGSVGGGGSPASLARVPSSVSAMARFCCTMAKLGAAASAAS